MLTHRITRETFLLKILFIIFPWKMLFIFLNFPYFLKILLEGLYEKGPVSTRKCLAGFFYR